MGLETFRTFQLSNCIGCKFTDEKKFKKGKPCCTYPGKIVVFDTVCQTRRGKEK